MIQTTPLQAREPTPEGWFVAASQVVQLAASGIETPDIFDSIVALLKEFGPLAIAVFVERQGVQSPLFSEGFSAQFTDILGRIDPNEIPELPATLNAQTAHDTISVKMRQEGIGLYHVWPLVYAEKHTGIMFVGITAPSAEALLPPTPIMDNLAGVVSLIVERKKLERISSTSSLPYQWHETLMNSIVQGDEIGFMVTDSLGRLMLLNPAGERLLGITEAQCSGRRLSDIDNRLSAMGRPEDVFKISRGRITVFPGDSEKNQIIAHRVSAFSHGGRDYYSWKLSEKSVSATDSDVKESRLSAFVNNERFASLHCNKEGMIQSRNSTLLRMLGGDESSIEIGMHINDASTLARAGLSKKMRECLNTGEPVFSSHEFVHPNRGPIHLSAYFAPIPLSNGDYLGVQGIIEDTTEHNKTRTSLLLSEERYRVFFRNAPIGLIEIDLTDVVSALTTTDVDTAKEPFIAQFGKGNRQAFALNITAANPAALALYGADSQGMLQFVFSDRNNGISSDELHRIMNAFLSGETTYRFTDVHRTVSGKCIHVDISLAVAPPDQGVDFSRVLISILDITQIKIMQSALQSQLVLERLISSISAKIVSLPPEKTRDIISDVLKDVGHALDVDNVTLFEFKGQHLQDRHRWTQKGHVDIESLICELVIPFGTDFLQTKNWRPIVIGQMDSIPNTSNSKLAKDFGLSSLLLMPLVVQKKLNGIMAFASKAVPKQWLEESLALLRILSDVVAGALDRQHREIRRRESEALLRTVFQSMAGGLIVVDSKSNVLLINPSAAKSLHLEDPLEFVGAPIEDLAKGTKEMLGHSSPGEQQQIMLTLHDGIRRTFGFTSARADSGRRIIVFRDLTKMLEADTRQKRAEELARLGMVVAKLSHDIKNPLASILLGLRALEDNDSLDNEVKYILSSLLEETRFLKTFVEDFLSATRFQEAHPVLRPVYSIFTTVKRAQERMAARAGVTLTLNTESESVVACVDKQAMIRAISNLVKNAIEACDKDDTIHIGYRTLSQKDTALRFPKYQGEVLCLYVEDSGPGMPETVMENLFIPFTTTKSRGNGLGLSMVKETITGHGGVIEVITPVHPNGGTRFEILLPKGGRPSCMDKHKGCNIECKQCPMPEGCPVKELENYYTCWIVKGKASLLETGKWNEECTKCAVYQLGNLEHYYLNKNLRKDTDNLGPS